MNSRMKQHTDSTVWKLVGQRGAREVLKELVAGRKRYMDILHGIGGISSRTLTKRLRELETAGVVCRVVYPEMPVRIEYRLTPKGTRLENAICEMERLEHGWIEDERSRA